MGLGEYPCEYYRVPCEYYRVPCEYYEYPCASMSLGGLIIVKPLYPPCAP